jgi:hypothetical protein
MSTTILLSRNKSPAIILSPNWRWLYLKFIQKVAFGIRPLFADADDSVAQVNSILGSF